MYYSSTSPSVIFILAALALIATILCMIFIVPDSRRAAMGGFGRWLHDLFNFKGLLIEAIIKFLYIFCTFAVILAGIVMLFSDSYYMPWYTGLAAIFLGPVAVRLLYECMMLFLLLVKNTIQINNKLSAGSRPAPTPTPTPRPAPAPAPTPRPTPPPVNRCPKCGAATGDSTKFCPRCGAALTPSGAGLKDTRSSF